ncbi:NAC domain-containing protein 90 [Apostasia shenzhenica]|uniref:NAC domain-containing protein 90 n=1 Tax=Apostasia shenzhenica TaxID=1088818 RepID=A0A2I0BG84_9ASPA|nr:NAC domain-containing protein 90 [Apostasia shenzhenica]
MERAIPVVDFFSHEPWQLPQLSGELCVQGSDQCFFFAPQQEREAQGGRAKRTTAAGYWKATGSPTIVFDGTRRVGVRKTMVFYEGRAPMGKKTNWVMNEYRLFEDTAGFSAGDHATDSFLICRLKMQIRAEFSLCRLYVRSSSLRSFDRRPPPEAGEAGTSRRQEAAPPAASGKRRRSPTESFGQSRA